jgi:segregation and condensation protein B
MPTPLFLSQSRDTQRKILEALIFASDEPLTPKLMFKILVLEEGFMHSESSGETTQQNLALPTSESVKQNESGTLPSTQDTDATDSVEKPTTQEDNGEVDATLSTRKNAIDIKSLVKITDELVQEINDELSATERPYRVVKIAGGYQFATTSYYGEYVARLAKSRTKRRLSQAALEVLSIVAYKQPISKPEIEAIRGINSNEVINSLVEKNLVTISGRSEAVGKPLLYGTTDDFLRTFGLHSTNDLPKLQELDELFHLKATELSSTMDFSVKTTSEEIIEKVQSLVENEQRMADLSSLPLQNNASSTDEVSEEPILSTDNPTPTEAELLSSEITLTVPSGSK